MDSNHVMYKLFSSFEQNNIKYLHFKSNTNLLKSFQGTADFDVLVDKDRISDVERLILENNGKRHNPIHIGNYPGVDNWLVFDELTGIVYHLHLHYQLATGKSLVKDYIIPWNELLFSTRIKDHDHDIFITNPNVELLLLAFRSVLKAKNFDYIKKLFGLFRLSKSMQEEWDDLFSKSSQAEIKKIVDIICPTQSDKVVEILSKKDLTYNDYLWFHRYVRRMMSNHRRMSGISATLKSMFYRYLMLFRRIWSAKFGGLSIIRKTSLQGGLIIAFVGVDGAGKSTISNEIAKWMRISKIECRRFYMGTGDGKTTIFNSFMKKVRKYKSKKAENNQSAIKPKSNVGEVSLCKHPILFMKRYLRILQILSVEKNNKRKIKRMYKYKLNGGVSVLDRWPQLEIVGQNDGPKVVVFEKMIGNKKFIRRQIEKENSNLEIVKEIKADLIFRLNITIDTCMNRKPEHVDREAFAQKLNELNQLKYQGSKVVEINAEMPYEDEILQIKRVLWKYV